MENLYSFCSEMFRYLGTILFWVDLFEYSLPISTLGEEHFKAKFRCMELTFEQSL